LGGLVNNAGFAQPGAVEDLTRETLQRQFEVNVFGMQQLTNRFISLFRSQGWGRIVNVSSVFGRIAMPMVGGYCASKFAMEALSDAMRLELCKAGIGVSLVEPGAIISRFRDNAADMVTQTLDVANTQFGKSYERAMNRKKNKVQKPSLLVRPPEEVAKKIHHALASPRPHARYCVSIAAYFVAFMRRFAPTWFLDAMLVKRVGK
jgi:NAD(P)-dependent dehydrogenase (short-subunit alcohol dehydrogenase family)